jgi:hypothetical protein
MCLGHLPIVKSDALPPFFVAPSFLHYALSNAHKPGKKRSQLMQTSQSEVGAHERLLSGFGGLFLVAKSSAKVPQKRSLMPRHQVAKYLRVAVKAIAYELLICATH